MLRWIMGSDKSVRLSWPRTSLRPRVRQPKLRSNACGADPGSPAGLAACARLQGKVLPSAELASLLRS